MNVFRPPFQSGRTSPEASLSRADQPLTTSLIPEGPGAEEEELHATEAGDAQEQDIPSPEMGTEQVSANSAEDLNSLSTHTTDSGFSELLSSSQDPFGEKETSCEKAVKPEGNLGINYRVLIFLIYHFCILLELTFVLVCVCTSAAITGYQQPSDCSGSQFYISLQDANNKEVKLEDKG